MLVSVRRRSAAASTLGVVGVAVSDAAVVEVGIAPFAPLFRAIMAETSCSNRFSSVLPAVLGNDRFTSLAVRMYSKLP